MLCDFQFSSIFEKRMSFIFYSNLRFHNMKILKNTTMGSTNTIIIINIVKKDVSTASKTNVTPFSIQLHAIFSLKIMRQLADILAEPDLESDYMAAFTKTRKMRSGIDSTGTGWYWNYLNESCKEASIAHVTFSISSLRRVMYSCPPYTRSNTKLLR